MKSFVSAVLLSLSIVMLSPAEILAQGHGNEKLTPSTLDNAFGEATESCDQLETYYLFGFVSAYPAYLSQIEGAPSSIDDETKVLGRLMLGYSAEQGHIKSQFLLAFLNKNGAPGYIENDAIALEWAERAAKQGSFDAMILMMVMYLGDEGIPEDFQRAYHWSLLAYTHIDQESLLSMLAPELLDNLGSAKDELARMLSTQEIARMQQEASSWRKVIEDGPCNPRNG